MIEKKVNQDENTELPLKEENLDSNEKSEDKKAEKPPKPDSSKLKKLETKLLKTEKLLSQKEEELSAANDKYLRMIAEYDNYRKRVAKEREGLYTETCSDVIGEFLPILDNLERAATFTDGKEVSQGVTMLCKLFYDTLTKLGISEIEAEGQPFDPNVHNAVMHIEDAAHSEGEIIDVLQKGYRKGDRVIRYSMVKVAK